jgi:hypothetical protein
MQEVGLYPIISTGNFYDGLINLNKFFRIVGVVILINVVCFVLGRPPDLPEWPRQSTEATPPCWSNALAGNHYGGFDVLSRICLRSSITLRRSSQLWSYSRILRLCVMHRRTSFSARCRFGLAEEAASLRAYLARSLWPADCSLRGPLVDFSATMRFAASAPC